MPAGKRNPLQLDFPLTPDSVVFDVGGYQGLWTEDIIQRNGFVPNVYIFEPVFFGEIWPRPEIQIFPFGLGARDEKATFGVGGDGTGVWRESAQLQTVEIRDIGEVVAELGITQIDLISINCEGGEYDILERMLETGIVKNCEYIQIQFHNLFPEATERREKIREGLAITHTEYYNLPWRWEAWKRS